MPRLHFLLLLTFTYIVVLVHISFHVSLAKGQNHDMWSSPSAMTMSVYPGGGDTYFDINEADGLEGGGGRSLYWIKRTYYISYGALVANRVPCPPRSGRSYYTHDCFNARGPAHPYSRGCSAISRCRR